MVTIIGAGIAGLLCAAELARAGREVIVHERAAEPGGRAATHRVDGFSLNLGPHALYRKGALASALAELGVEVAGREPRTGSFALADDTLHPLPTTAMTILSSGLFGWAGRAELVRHLARLRFLDDRALDAVPLGEWPPGDPTVRAYLHALARVSTYTNDPEMAAGAVVRQLRLALGGVLYLDGGWGTIVTGLRAAAEAAGARIVTGHDVSREELAGTVVVATSRAQAARFVDLPPARPVRAACLDVGLTSLPRPDRGFVLGIDAPLYLSVHSATARLAPDGAALVHVMKYLPPGADGDAGELEALLDLAQPGWRAHVATRRFLPALTVQGDTRLAGRVWPGVRQGDVWVCGDWVGAGGALADGAAASAREVARGILAAEGRRDAA